MRQGEEESREKKREMGGEDREGERDNETRRERWQRDYYEGKGVEGKRERENEKR